MSYLQNARGYLLLQLAIKIKMTARVQMTQLIPGLSSLNVLMILGLTMLLSSRNTWCCEAKEIQNLNFQLPLRAAEPIKLDLLEYSTKSNRIIGYFHIANDFSSSQHGRKQTIDHHLIPIIFATYQQQQQHQRQFSAEKNPKFPLQPTSITCLSTFGSEKTPLFSDPSQLAFKPKRYRFELEPFDKKHLLVGKRIEIDLVVRLSTSGICATDNNNYDFPYKFNLILDTNENAYGLAKVEEINFVNGFFYSKENLRLYSLAHFDSIDGKPERLEGFVAVRNLSFNKKVILRIKVGSSQSAEQEIEAFWVYSANSQVDMFRFSFEFNKWDSGFERAFTIKSIEYFWDGGKDVDTNNNATGYSMILNAHSEVIPEGLCTFFTALATNAPISPQKRHCHRQSKVKTEELKKLLKELKTEMQKSSDLDEEFVQISRKGIVNLEKAPVKSCLKSQSTFSTSINSSKESQINLLAKEQHPKNVTFGAEDEVKEIDP